MTTEATFQQQVTDLCNWLHLRWFHDNDSRQLLGGGPDVRGDLMREWER